MVAPLRLFSPQGGHKGAGDSRLRPVHPLLRLVSPPPRLAGWRSAAPRVRVRRRFHKRAVLEGAGNRMQLTITAGADAGRTVQVQGNEFTIGREVGADLVLADGKASRRHAALRPLPDGRATLYDLGSSNGTFVNGQRVQSMLLQGGEQIQIGDTVLVPGQAAVPGAQPVGGATGATSPGAAVPATAAVAQPPAAPPQPAVPPQ